jgi:hypothetical protein
VVGGVGLGVLVADRVVGAEPLAIRLDGLTSLARTSSTSFTISGGCLAESANGAVIVVYAGIWNSWQHLGTVGTSSAERSLRVTGDEGETAWSGFRAAVYPNRTIRLAAPHWFLISVGVASSAVPWLPRRFGHRTLLIAMTVVAVGLGAIVYSMR